MKFAVSCWCLARIVHMIDAVRRRAVCSLYVSSAIFIGVQHQPIIISAEVTAPGLMASLPRVGDVYVRRTRTHVHN